MKKTLSALLFLALSTSLQAQLKVDYAGNVIIGQNVETPDAYLTIANADTSITTSSKNIAVNCGTVFRSGKFNIGIMTSSLSNTAQTTGRSYGLFATAGNGQNGRNYGVFGRLFGNNNGAGIYGSVGDNMGSSVPGKYAGYFNGATYVNGTLTATSVVTPSDIRLKENITLLKSDTDSSDGILARLMAMNVIKYNYIDRYDEDSDTTQLAIPQATASKQMHYGVSAQELLQIFPDLVLDGQDGYLGVNYVEMVPLLLRSIQELKQKVDELESEDMAMSGSTTSVSSAELTSNVLYQNSPNPCKQQTTIRFSLEANVSNAALCIFDMSGKLVMKLPISPSMENVTIDANDLSEGIYLYSLVVNGKEVNSKRMIVIK